MPRALQTSLLLVGPQRLMANPKDLTKLRSIITNTPDLVFLRERVSELESLWPTIVETYPPLHTVHGKETLSSLHQFLEGGALPSLEQLSASNILLNVLTVLSHAVDFWDLATTKVQNDLFPRVSAEPSIQLHDIQGFCIGFLTAAAVASSKTKADFETYMAVALRLAVCVGALVELDNATSDRAASVSVCWSSVAGYEEFIKILENHQNGYIACVTDINRVTATISERDKSSFMQQVSQAGLSVQPIHLPGRYHSRHTHEDAVRSLKALCERDPRFQLPNAGELVLPLRSNKNGGLISTGLLHEIALESILLEQCQWAQTVQSSMAHTSIDVDGIVSVGADTVVPRSNTKSSSVPITKAERITNGVPRKLTNEQPLPQAIHHAESDIAVIGMACRYPNADSLEEFWELISSGQSAIRRVPEDRFKPSEVKREPRGEFWGNFLRHPDQFDHRFFGLSGREAKFMDAQQRLVLHVAYEALESSGYFGVRSSPDHFPSDIGCYIGVGSVDYADNIASHDATAFSALGTLRAFISGRVSHNFGWSGPSITYDTACSSGAVAIHAAISALKANECSMAVAGGVNVITSPALFQNLAAASFLSPTGASKAFDAGANGYCRGEGAGLVVLKPLARALADGDPVLAVISGSAVNQGSNCSPITVPVSESQSALYKKALSVSRVHPDEVSFVEAHGTGTPVGDPIELESIRSTFGGPLRAHKLFVGSVKDNVGHTEAASGAASLIKTILMIQKRVIPKQANFTLLNPKIGPLEPDRMAVPLRTQPWTSPQRIAVVNNYGAAGSNAAIVVRDINEANNDLLTRNDAAASTPLAELPFFISAKTPESLRNYSMVLKCALPSIEEKHGPRASLNLAYNLSVKQNRTFEYNYTFTAANLDELAANLDLAGSCEFKKRPTDQRPVVLCIGGQSGRTVHLDEDLFRNSKILQKHLGDCDRTCRDLGLPTLFPTIFKDKPVEDLVNLHCMLFSLQYASAKAWLDSGLNVDTIVGHSFGQLTALVVADVLSLSDGLLLISERARLIQTSWGDETGAMISIEGDMANVEHLLEGAQSRYPSFAADIACYNGPRTVVIAGDQASIDAIEEAAKVKTFAVSLKLVRLKNTHAFHSRLVDGIVPGLTKVAEALEFKRPSVRIEACSRDQDWSQCIGAEQIVQHSRMPVYFRDAVERTSERLGSSIWVEAGSASPIISMVRRALTVADADNVHVFQAVDMRTPSAVSKLARATSNLWAAGVKVQYWLFHQSQKALYSWINLPPYQFQQTSHWLEYIPPSVASQEPAQTIAKDEPLKLLHSMNRTPDGVTFGVNCTHDIFKLCTEGHAVLGQSLCPASMYVEMAVQAVTQLSGGSVSGAAPSVRDLKISSPLSISTNRRVSLRLVPVNREQDTWEYAVISRGQQNAAHPVTHATGIISLNLAKISFESSRMQSFQRLVGQARYEYLSKVPDSNILTRKIVYQVFGQVVDYAPYFRGVEQIVSNDNEAVGTVSVPRDQPSIMKEATCDPITLDNFLQVAGIHVNCLSERNEDELYVCTELGELFLSEKFLATRREMDSWSVYSTFERSSSKRLINDIFVWDSKTGDLLVMFLGAVFQGVPKKLLAKTLATLNSNPNLAGSQNGQSAAQIKSMRMETNKLTQGVNIDTLVKTNGVTSSRNGVQSNRAAMLQKVRELLSSVIDIPIDDVQPSATLAGLGIDSLMSTEVLNELKTRFDVAIQAADFLRMNDVQSLAEHLTTSAVVDESQMQVPHPKQAQSNGHENGNVSPIQQVQKLFGGLLGISDSEIVADALLSDLGVDSLMATEVLNEITKRFDVTITADELQDLQDIRSLANRLQELSSASNPPNPQRNGHSNHHLNGHVNGQRLGKASQAAESFTSIAHGSFTKIQRNFDKISTKTSFTDFYRYVYPSQMQLVVAYVVEAFRAMGSSLETLSAGESVNDITVLSKHNKVKNQIYRILEDQNIIQRDSTGKFVRTSVSLPQGPSERLHQEIVANFPQHAFEHNLLASTGSKLADCLTGRADPLAILFGSANARTLMENVYTHAPMFKNGTINLAQYLVDLFNNFTDETRPIHILELGAGTGGTTKHLIECLAATHRKFQYTFTDLSSSLVAAARKKFSHHDFMRYAVLNIEEESPVQLQGQYDIVISTNCIHATKNLTRSCTNINKLLQPNGILCLVELTRNLFWFDLVFGLLEGWWLFEDGRQHALANENLWKKHLLMSNFRWIDWTVGRSDESNLLRLITASPSNPTPVVTTETVEFKRASGQSLQADIYYPQRVLDGQTMLPIALMIHGGGHIMLSRKDIRPPQTKILLDAGFLPVSVDYRLCPEMTLPEGPMQDVCDALSWARTTLPTLPLQRHDVRVDGDHVVAVGWSTGGHLALTLGFTAPQAGIRPPDAILAFYCPLDYEDPFWSQPNKPFSQDTEGKLQYDLLEGVYERPITAYNPSPAHRALGGWMAPNDPRSRIALHMNWKGRTLRVLLNKLSPDSGSSSDPTDDLPEPTLDRIQSVSPLAQIQQGAYRVPTFIIHGTKDDLIPWQQAMRTYEALRQKDVIAEVRILEGAAHLFDLYQSYKTDEKAIRVVQEGYEFLRRHVIR